MLLEISRLICVDEHFDSAECEPWAVAWEHVVGEAGETIKNELQPRIATPTRLCRGSCTKTFRRCTLFFIHQNEKEHMELDVVEHGAFSTENALFVTMLS